MAKGKKSTPTSLYRNRRSFAKIPDVMDVPNLIGIQIDSFKWFVDHGFVTKKNLGEILEATIALERPTYRPMLLALREETISPDEGKLRL